MIFLQLWWTLMVLTGGNGNNEGIPQQQQMQQPQQQPSTGSEELRNFHNSLQEARDQLREIHANYEQVQGADLYRDRRNTIDDLLSSFAQAGDQQQDKQQQQEAYDWLIGNFEAEPAAGAGPSEADQAEAAGEKPSREAGHYESPYGKAFDQTEVGKVKKKYQDKSEENFPVKTLNVQPQLEDLHGAATELDIKLRHMQQRLHNQELLERRDSKKELNEPKETQESSSLRSYGNVAVPDGVYERTMQRLQESRGNSGNNLSHEANYKLSKIEQDAAEQAAKSRYPNGLKKRSSSGGRFNPMNEIKLKTSNRLMRRGMGPSLPSRALTDSLRSRFMNGVIAQRERQQQEPQQEQDGEDTAEPMALPYGTLTEIVPSPAESQLAAEESSSEHVLDMLQSYDYRMPNFEHFPALRQRQSSRNLRDYEHENAKLQMSREPERFKRHPEQQLNAEPRETAPEGSQSQAQVEPASAVKDSMPEAEELLARLSAPLPSTSADGNQAQEAKEPKVSEAGETKSVQAATAAEADVAQQPQVQEQLPAKQRELQEAAAIAGGNPKREEPRLLKDHSDAVIKLLANKMSQHAGDKDRDKRNAKRWAWQRARRLKPGRSAANEAPHYKRRSKRSLDQPLERKESEERAQSEQQLERILEPGSETPQLKEKNSEAEFQAEVSSDEQDRSKRYSKLQLDNLSVEADDELEGQDQAQGCQSRSGQLDAFEDHNGNRRHYGHLGNDLLLDPDEAAVEDSSDGGEGVANLKEDEAAMDLGSTDTNIFSSSRYQVPMVNQRPSMIYGPPYLPQHQQQLLPSYLQQYQPQQQLQQLPQQPQLKYNVNFTHLLNELAKLQKMPQQQPNANINQMKSLYGIHRVFAPHFGKGASSIQGSLCETTIQTTTAAAAAAAASETAAPATAATCGQPSSTLNPDCVPILGKAAATAATTASPSVAAEDNSICSRPESVKLNVSLNANVGTDPRTNQFFGNGSISVQPSGSGYADYEEERYLRQTREHSEEAKERKEQRKNEKGNGSRKQQKAKAEAKQKQKSRVDSSSSSNSSSSTAGKHGLDQNDPYSEQYSKLISGKLSDDIVHAVLDMVSNDPSLEALAAVLAKNRKCSMKSPKYFYQIRNDANEKQLEQTENLVRHTMETISDLIDKQMQVKNCIPLRPDLVEFYDLIMKTMAEQKKTREKREATLRMLADDLDPEQKKFLQPTNIEQKSRIVKKLLNQYEELPAEQQQQMANARDELLMDLVYLRKMSETLERNQRDALLSGLMQHEESEAGQAYGDYSPRFLKLLKTAEIFKEVGEQQAKDFNGF